MGKSRAEIQKAYRQRLKEKNNAEYLQRERDRMRRNYVPSSSLSENDRKKRNARNRQKLREFYDRKRQQRIAVNQSDDIESSGYESAQAGPSEERGRLPVRIPFPSNRRKGAVKRWKRELSEAHARIKLLEEEREELRKRFRSAQRSVQRQKQKKQIASTSTSASNLTPSKETERMMRDANLTEQQKNSIKKSLLLGNVLVHEIKSAKSATSRSKVKSIHSIISGRCMKKYKCSTMLSKVTGLCRHRLNKNESKFFKNEKSSRSSTVKRHQNRVVSFMKREDNSRTQPGKQDTKRLKKGLKVQTHVLTDYLTNLYNKFKSENPTIKISFTSFCRCRPKYILTAAFSSRSSCLCTRHQNASLTVKTLRREGFNISVNPEIGVGQIPSPDELKDKLGENIALGQWTRVEVEEKGKKKYVTKIVESQMSTDKFVSHVENQMSEFEAHVNRVRTQYEQIRTLKEKLPEHEMLIQLDFAENYSCKSLEEVQSAYFHQTSVTLHPMVVYYRADGTLVHKSFIIVSDEMAHRSSTVITFINELMPKLKQIDNELKCIHYWSDSPTSQYRNKHVFDFVANHKQLHGMNARWNYFEAGHGKGPCDGLGGTCKRLADEAMRSGKVIIQDAVGFYEWAIQSSMSNVVFHFIPTTLCSETETLQEACQLKSIKGTMKIHAVVGLGENTVKIRDVSCYCDVCLSGQTCTSWKVETTRNAGKHKMIPVTKQTNTTTSEPKSPVSNEHNIDIPESDKSKKGSTVMPFQVDNYVAAVYDSKWYIGKVTDTDEKDREVEVNFMESRKQFFQWPRNQDSIWLDQDAILCKINSLEATGKSRRMFRLADGDQDKILELFSKFTN